MIPENRDDDREPLAPGSSELRDMAHAWQVPPDGEAPADDPRFTLAELIDRETKRYRSWGTDVGDFFAGQMESLASLVRWMKVTSVKDLSDYIHGLSEGLDDED